MAYAHLMFANDGERTAAEQLMVLEERTGYGVLDSHDAEERRISIEPLKHTVECVALQCDDCVVSTAAREEIADCCIVETSGYALYCNLSVHVIKINNPEPLFSRSGIYIITFFCQKTGISAKISII